LSIRLILCLILIVVYDDDFIAPNKIFVFLNICIIALNFEDDITHSIVLVLGCREQKYISSVGKQANRSSVKYYVILLMTTTK